MPPPHAFAPGLLENKMTVPAPPRTSLLSRAQLEIESCPRAAMAPPNPRPAKPPNPPWTRFDENRLSTILQEAELSTAPPEASPALPTGLPGGLPCEEFP